MTFPDHLNRAFLRSRCMGAFATIEDTGIPIDKPFYTAVRDHREALQTALIAAWQRAGREVLGGFTLRVDAKTFAHPGRFIDDKGDSLLLKTVQRVLLEKTGVLHGA